MNLDLFWYKNDCSSESSGNLCYSIWISLPKWKGHNTASLQTILQHCFALPGDFDHVSSFVQRSGGDMPASPLPALWIPLTWCPPFLYSAPTPQHVIVLSPNFLHCLCELQLTTFLFIFEWCERALNSPESVSFFFLYNVWLKYLAYASAEILLQQFPFLLSVVPKPPISALSYLPHLHTTQNTEHAAAVELHFTSQRHLSVRSLTAVRTYCFLAWHLHGSSIKYCLPQQLSCPDKWNSPFCHLFSCKHYFSIFLYSSHLHQLWFGTMYTQTIHKHKDAIEKAGEI